ncbi:sec-independent protein translocase protein TatC [Friedmanniella luteola]|uniref:Sec-independent protein translocase protein TatC n=1 Tax=Friedmanniella luteola TaxID=546871 RepID=A0A1H1QY20_9ACTN|nr:twin-arginine translocase subunit TatC [Friedmanniella luteola]SDS28266.1 sec-independent protein translocase protein TatC [Friedmanniella luteola]
MSLTIKGRPLKLSFAWLRPPPAPADGSMTLFEHLRELRYRLVVAALAITVGTIVAWFFRGVLIDVLLAPYYQAAADLKAKNPAAVLQVVNNGIASPFTLALKVSALAGLILTSPIWLWQVWSFIVPGLLAKEKKWAMIFIAAATPLFCAGVAVGYIVMPKGISVLLGFTEGGVTNLQDINQFLSFLMRLMLVFGAAFLIPLVVLMLNILGVVPARYLSKYRTYVIFGTFVFGAIATPSTDPFSMLALAAPMTVLFLAAEIIAHILDRRKARRAALAGDDLLLAGSVDQDTALQQLSEDDDDDDGSRSSGS